MKILSEKIMSTEQVESETDYVLCKVDKYGHKRYFNTKGLLHREDGPAIEYVDDCKYWCLNGKFHRKDGPAREYTNGNKYWYINNKHHREDGPAIELADGNKYWYLNDEIVTEETVRKLGKMK